MSYIDLEIMLNIDGSKFEDKIITRIVVKKLVEIELCFDRQKYSIDDIDVEIV